MAAFVPTALGGGVLQPGHRAGGAAAGDLLAVDAKPLDGRNRLFNWRLVRDTRGKLSTDGCQPVLLHLGGLVLDLLTRRPCRPALRPGRRFTLTTTPLPGYHS